MALILLLETATASCSVALSDNEEIIAYKEANEKNIHASHITLFIEDVIREAGKTMKDIQAVAVSRGPGSYTGLRIGVSTAKGICYALDVPLIAIDTLRSMAEGFISMNLVNDEESYYCPMIDARRMEVYTAVFDKNLSSVYPVEAKIIDHDSFAELLDNHKITFFGDGAFKCQGVLSSKNAIIHNDFVNSARHMGKMAFEKFKTKNFEDVAYFEPFYLKEFLALQPKGL